MKGALPGDAPLYLPAWAWVQAKIAPLASECRMLFGKNAVLVSVWLDEGMSEVLTAYSVRFTNGIMNTYQLLPLDITHPQSRVALKEAWRGRSMEEGIKIAKEIYTANVPLPEPHLGVAYKPFLFAQQIGIFIDRAQQVGWERSEAAPKKEVHEESCGLAYDNYWSKPRRLDVEPMPPGMRGFLHMPKDRFIKWLREISWPMR